MSLMQLVCCISRLVGKERYSQFNKTCIVETFKHLQDGVSLFQLDDILDKKISLALVELPQILPSNRLPNANFSVLIKTKTRTKLFNEITACICGKNMDPHGDHAFTCPKVCKTPTHDEIHDTLAEQLWEILPMINLVDSPTMVETEPVGMIPELPHLRPYDVCITLGHTIANSPYKTPLSHIGLDVTVPNPLWFHD